MGTQARLGLTLRRRAGAPPEPLWLEWLALAGVLGFATWLLGARGVWALLLNSDPTGITLVIVIVFAASTLWCGARARVLQVQRNAFGAGRTAPGWAADYWAALSQDKANSDTALDLLMEHTHGPHGTAWWVNAVQLKLGLLGKVIGFSILALDIGHMQGFDAGQSQDLLRSLTTGLGVALLTTMVGLVGNILLGLQLTRLDRYADQLVADIQRVGLARWQGQLGEPP
ncbi:MotA/TolQ/ExbB proton channel family protein [Variovorax sp. dw_954]|uniref:MotA/TolQ/ExbB proton channel family protein n=1 Tax=Variovorax sp. dw_954 TaxID=2720078 RepID=UPI001BD54A71|nr:MotA/TolQ/ExbB proton channel family protein [Variovorax sp. dw_954]